MKKEYSQLSHGLSDFHALQVDQVNVCMSDHGPLFFASIVYCVDTLHEFRSIQRTRMGTPAARTPSCVRDRKTRSGFGRFGSSTFKLTGRERTLEAQLFKLVMRIGNDQP